MRETVSPRSCKKPHRSRNNDIPRNDVFLKEHLSAAMHYSAQPFAQMPVPLDLAILYLNPYVHQKMMNKA